MPQAAKRISKAIDALDAGDVAKVLSFTSIIRVAEWQVNLKET
jgi:hypothetical protein